MPGVPTYRGCEACHRQKKKCDQVQPACSRCTRLRIQCEGRGKLRYRFQHKFSTDPVRPATAIAKSCQISNVTTPSTSSTPPSRERSIAPRSTAPISVLPSNEDTKLAQEFVSLLEIADPRFDLTCYGPWLIELPRRLGSNKALDAAIKAFSLSFPFVYTQTVSTEALKAYGKGIQALRECVMDPEESATQETLCAIYLNSVCQTWIGTDHSSSTSHIVGMISVLRASSSKNSPNHFTGYFDKQFRRTLGFHILIGSIYDENIQLDDLSSVLQEADGPRQLTQEDGTNYPSLELATLTRIPDFLRHPIRNIKHIRVEYQLLQAEIPRIKLQMHHFRNLVSGNERYGGVPSRLVSQAYTAILAGYAMLLAIGSCLAAILHAYDSANDELPRELDDWADQICYLAEFAAIYRPLGSSYMGLPLIAALASATSPKKTNKIRSLIDMYQSDFPDSPWLYTAQDLADLYERIRRKRAATYHVPVLEASIDVR